MTKLTKKYKDRLDDLVKRELEDRKINKSNLLKIYDNNTMVLVYKTLYYAENDNFVHFLTVAAEISDDTDLILFLREGQFCTGDINTKDDYQFNDYLYTGSDLIDLLKEYNINE